MELNLDDLLGQQPRNVQDVQDVDENVDGVRQHQNENVQPDNAQPVMADDRAHNAPPGGARDLVQLMGHQHQNDPVQEAHAEGGRRILGIGLPMPDWSESSVSDTASVVTGSTLPSLRLGDKRLLILSTRPPEGHFEQRSTLVAAAAVTPDGVRLDREVPLNLGFTELREIWSVAKGNAALKLDHATAFIAAAAEEIVATDWVKLDVAEVRQQEVDRLTPAQFVADAKLVHSAKFGELRALVLDSARSRFHAFAYAVSRLSPAQLQHIRCPPASDAGRSASVAPPQQKPQPQPQPQSVSPPQVFGTDPVSSVRTGPMSIFTCATTQGPRPQDCPHPARDFMGTPGGDRSDLVKPKELISAAQLQAAAPIQSAVINKTKKNDNWISYYLHRRQDAIDSRNSVADATLVAFGSLGELMQSQLLSLMDACRTTVDDVLQKYGIVPAGQSFFTRFEKKMNDNVPNKVALLQEMFAGVEVLKVLVNKARLSKFPASHVHQEIVIMCAMIEWGSHASARPFDLTQSDFHPLMVEALTVDTEVHTALLKDLHINAYGVVGTPGTAAPTNTPPMATLPAAAPTVAPNEKEVAALRTELETLRKKVDKQEKQQKATGVSEEDIKKLVAAEAQTQAAKEADRRGLPNVSTNARMKTWVEKKVVPNMPPEPPTVSNRSATKAGPASAQAQTQAGEVGKDE